MSPRSRCACIGRSRSSATSSWHWRPTRMRCEDLSARIADDLAGTLGEADRAAMRQHLEGCADCRRQTEGLDVLWRALEQIPVPAPDSRALRARLDAAIQREQEPARRAPRAIP